MIWIGEDNINNHWRTASKRPFLRQNLLFSKGGHSRWIEGPYKAAGIMIPAVFFVVPKCVVVRGRSDYLDDALGLCSSRGGHYGHYNRAARKQSVPESDSF